MSRETLEFLSWLLSQQSVSAGAPDARHIAERLFTAQDEVAAELSLIGEQSNG